MACLKCNLARNVPYTNVLAPILAEITKVVSSTPTSPQMIDRGFERLPESITVVPASFPHSTYKKHFTPYWDVELSLGLGQDSDFYIE